MLPATAEEMKNPEKLLVDMIRGGREPGDGFTYDPYGFVMYVYPWGVKGTELEDFSGPDTWQIEVMEHIREEYEKKNNAMEAIQTAMRIAVTSGHSIGKAQSVSSKVISVKIDPQTKRAISMQEINWGELKPGDYVFGSDGEPTKVLQIHPQGVKPIYKITFDDGSSSECCLDHLWSVRGRAQRRHGLKDFITMSTKEIINKGVLRKNGKATTRQWEIPVQSAVQMEYKTVYDAYTVGVWLGDGDSATGRITSTRDELWKKIGVSPNKDTLAYKKNRVMTAAPKGLTKELNIIGMSPVTCDTKFIADCYKYNSEKVRRDLVSGMLDADGEVHQSGSIGYSSSSKQLVDDLIWMVRSLGGKAMMQPTVKKTGYKKDGVFHSCKDCYRCTISFGGKWNPFTHTYKKEKVASNVKRYTHYRMMESIVYSHDEEAMCITVDAKDHLYLANDFIVTHNSALISWIIHWFISVFDDPQIVVTANTKSQLSTTTWRELAKWWKLSIHRSWFTWQATTFKLIAAPETWCANAIPWSENNSEAFAGKHAKNVLFMFDEASAVADIIWEVSEGAMTTFNCMWVAFGNPTRNTGAFAQCFKRYRHRWWTRCIDARTAKMADHNLIKEWIEDYGIDSDFVRVRALGKFPRAGDMQLIPVDVVEGAVTRTCEVPKGTPRIMGVDVARYGSDMSVIARRHGRRLEPLSKYRGLDTMQLASVVSHAIRDERPDMVMVDGTGIGAGVIDRLRQLGHDVLEVHFGGKVEPGSEMVLFNKRIEMWHRMSVWLKTGDIPRDPELYDDLIGPEYYFDVKMRMRLESKDEMRKRGLASPDCGDAVCLTFAYVAPPRLDYDQSELEPEWSEDM